MILALILAGWLSASSSAFAEGPIRIAFGCAPWDGPTLDITIRMPDSTIDANIWGRGYPTLSAKRKIVEIDNDGGPKGTGRGKVCSTMVPGGSCSPQRLRFVFSTLELRLGGKVVGTVSWAGGHPIPFEGVIEEFPALCG